MFHLFRDYYTRIKGFSKNIRLFILAEIFIGIGMIFWFLLFNLYLQDGGYDKKSISDILLISNIAAVIFALPAGYFSGRYNHKMMLITSRISATLFFLFALSTLDKMSLGSLMFLAFASATFMGVVTGPFVMVNSARNERTYIFSINFIINLGGGVIGNILAGLIKEAIASYGVPSVMAYRYTMMSGVALSAIGIIPLFFIKTGKTAESTDEPIKLSQIRNWKWGFFAKAVIPSTLIGVGAGLIVQFLNLYFKDMFNSSDSSIGFYMSWQSITMALGVLIAPLIAEKLGKVNTIVLSELASIPFMLVLALTKNLELAVFAFVVRASLMNMAIPISNAFILELCKKEEQGILNALYTMNWSICWAFSAYLFGHIFKGNYPLTFFIAIGLYFASSILFYIFFRKSEGKGEVCEVKPYI